jgi:putative colanic acid biosynthesis glycosyltransferase WcaI
VSAPRHLVVLCPHFDPDTAPTGRVMSRIVAELAERGHHVDVVTALPWYRAHRIESGWTGRLVRTERTDWGTIRRLHPFPGRDKRNLARRLLGFLGFSALAGWAGLGAGGWLRRVDAVIAMSPPLTMGLTGRVVAWSHRAPLVFNVQDVFPDAAVRTGAITNRGLIAAARLIERISYRLSDAVTVLSDDLGANVVAKLPVDRAATVRTIPNFVDTDRIRPADRMTPYRAELGLGAEPVLLYAGNVGFSQSVELLVETARRMPGISVVINGEGAALDEVRRRADGLANVKLAGYVPEERLGELLATGDVHAVPLRRGLGSVSVPSKAYSSLAAGRPIVAAIDPGTVVPKLLDESGGGIAVPPDDPDRFAAAVAELTGDLDRARAMGERGRTWVARTASPAAVARTYESLVSELRRSPT